MNLKEYCVNLPRHIILSRLLYFSRLKDVTLKVNIHKCFELNIYRKIKRKIKNV